MKDLYMIPIVLLVFAFGWYIAVRADRFMEETLRQNEKERREAQSATPPAEEGAEIAGSPAPGESPPPGAGTTEPSAAPETRQDPGK